MGEEKCKIAVYLVVAVDFNICTVADVLFLEFCLARGKKRDSVNVSCTLLLHYLCENTQFMEVLLLIVRADHMRKALKAYS